MSKSPAFQFYAADFDMDTNTWDNEEVGVYIRLLISQWVNGPLPDDQKKLAKIARISPKKFQKIFPVMAPKFSKNTQGKLQNNRLEETRVIQHNRRKLKSEGGKKGAEITNSRRRLAAGIAAGIADEIDGGLDGGIPSPF